MQRCMWVLLFSLLVPGCGSDSEDQSAGQGDLQTEETSVDVDETGTGTGETVASDEPVYLSQLGPGPHLGMITGFDVLTTADYNQPARVAGLTADAAAVGMNISRFQLDWAELETGPGVYDAGAMAELLDRIAANPLSAYITLSSIDTGELTFPDYLLENGSLRAGLTVSSTEVIQAFESFLDWFVPQLSGTGTWGISIGNEGDTLIEDAVISQEDFIEFFRAGLKRVNALDSSVSASVTLTGGAYARFPIVASALLEDSDHATVNFYCLDDALQVTRSPTWSAYVSDLKSRAGAKPIFIQELGCPVGYGDDGAGAPPRPDNGMAGSTAIQAEFVDFMTQTFIADSQFIGATWFQLLDWSPELAASYTAPIADEGALAAAQLTEEWLATSGFCRWADGTCRPAWDQWLLANAAAQEERGRRTE